MGASLNLKSDFALLDVRVGRSKLLKALNDGASVKVTMTGVVDCAWGSFDGTSQEFAVTVKSLKASA